MAQLAVNTVDAMDPDPVRTLFVYDKNLADGYTPYDDGYANPPAPDATGRGMVVGVERQELALSEALANVAWAEDKPATGRGDLVDHKLTEWDDAGDADASPHSFLFVELAYTGPGQLNFAENPATGAPGEDYRIVVRDPRDKRQFGETPAAELSQTKIQARAIIPRVGRLTAARPYFTIANADDGYVPSMTVPAEKRSRMRVNFQQTRAVAPDPATMGTGGQNGTEWYTIAPQPFAPQARQVNGAEVLRSVDVNANAQILDTLAPGPGGAADPTTFRTQQLNRDTLKAIARADAADPDPNDLLRFEPKVNRENFGTVAEVPVVEILLQSRLNPLRRAKEHDPDEPDFDEHERDNPWITVDRMRVVTTRLDLFEEDDNDGTTDAFKAHFQPNATAAGPITENGGTNEAPKVASRVRTEPLLRASELAAVGRDNGERSLLDANARAADYGAFVFNSLGGQDRNNPGGHAGEMRPFALWQPHFDREFVGPADLIGVPLYDPEHLTGLTSSKDAAFGADAPGPVSALRKLDQEELTTVQGERRQLGLGYDPHAGEVAGLRRRPAAGSQRTQRGRVAAAVPGRLPPLLAGRGVRRGTARRRTSTPGIACCNTSPRRGGPRR